MGFKDVLLKKGECVGCTLEGGGGCILSSVFLPLQEEPVCVSEPPTVFINTHGFMGLFGSYLHVLCLAAATLPRSVFSYSET